MKSSVFFVAMSDIIPVVLGKARFENHLRIVLMEGDMLTRKRAAKTSPNEIRVNGDTAEIILANGMVAFIDAADLPLVSGYNWRHLKSTRTFYAQANVPNASPKKTVLMHRIILGLTDQSQEGDHRDSNGLNNRRSNIRPATKLQNRQHRQQYANSRAPYKGIHREKATPGKWKAAIKRDGAIQCLGYFDLPEDAARAYDAAAIDAFGEFARLNFPPKGD